MIPKMVTPSNGGGGREEDGLFYHVTISTLYFGRDIYSAVNRRTSNRTKIFCTIFEIFAFIRFETYGFTIYQQYYKGVYDFCVIYRSSKYTSYTSSANEAQSVWLYQYSNNRKRILISRVNKSFYVTYKKKKK